MNVPNLVKSSPEPLFRYGGSPSHLDDLPSTREGKAGEKTILNAYFK